MRVIKITIFFFFLALITTSLFNRNNKQEQKVLGQKSKRDSVTITASIRLQELKFKVYPEKRVPKTNNWSTVTDFKVRDSTTSEIYLHQVLTTNKQGAGVIHPTPSEFIPAGFHSVLIKGVSHLAKRYDGIEFEHQYENYDFTPYGDLLAGDTHRSNDNFINSLDVSTLIGKLNTSDYKNDLNQDTQVNSLDLSNQIFNLSKYGDF